MEALASALRGLRYGFARWSALLTTGGCLGTAQKNTKGVPHWVRMTASARTRPRVGAGEEQLGPRPASRAELSCCRFGCSLSKDAPRLAHKFSKDPHIGFIFGFELPRFGRIWAGA